MSLSLANHDASLPIAYRLYLLSWAGSGAAGQGQGAGEPLSKPSPRSPLSRSAAARRLPGGGADGRRLWQRRWAADGHHLSACATSRGPVPTRRCGRRARLHAAAVSNGSRTTADAAAARTAFSRSRSRHSPSACRKRRGNDRGAGNRGLALLALPGGECGRRIAITLSELRAEE